MQVLKLAKGPAAVGAARYGGEQAGAVLSVGPAGQTRLILSGSITRMGKRSVHAPIRSQRCLGLNVANGLRCRRVPNRAKMRGPGAALTRKMQFTLDHFKVPKYPLPLRVSRWLLRSRTE
jgi:hypothetical protein